MIFVRYNYFEPFNLVEIDLHNATKDIECNELTFYIFIIFLAEIWIVIQQYKNHMFPFCGVCYKGGKRES